MASARKTHFIRRVLDPKRMPESKSIPSAKAAELNRRTEDWERRQADKPKKK
jgi:hypothetical protein